MGGLIRGFRGFFSRLFRLKYPFAGASGSRTGEYPLDPAEFARLVKSGRRQDFEKLAQMLSSCPLAQDWPTEPRYLRKIHPVSDKHGIGRH